MDLRKIFFSFKIFVWYLIVEINGNFFSAIQKKREWKNGKKFIYIKYQFLFCSANITHIENEGTSHLAPCVFRLFEKYFKNKRDLTEHEPIIVNLIENSKSQEAVLMQNTVLSLLNNAKDSAMSAQIKNYLKRHDPGPKIAEKAKNYLIILTEPDELYYNINLLQVFWRRGADCRKF